MVWPTLGSRKANEQNRPELNEMMNDDDDFTLYLTLQHLRLPFPPEASSAAEGWHSTLRTHPGSSQHHNVPRPGKLLPERSHVAALTTTRLHSTNEQVSKHTVPQMADFSHQCCDAI